MTKKKRVRLRRLWIVKPRVHITDLEYVLNELDEDGYDLHTITFIGEDTFTLVFIDGNDD